MRYAALALALLAGCAQQQTVVWEKPDATQESFEADKRSCEFEVLKATQGVDPTYRTVVGQEADLAMRRRELTLSCMRSKGYTQR